MKTKDFKARHCLLGLALTGIFGVGCAAPNKTLVGQTFVGEDRSFKILMHKQETSGNKEQYVDQYVRVCTLRDGQEFDCKDTLVLQNVVPGSLY